MLRATCRSVASRLLPAGGRSAGLLGMRPASGEAASDGGKQLHVEVVDGGVAVVTFDAPGASVNTLGREVMDEFDAVVTRLETDSSIRAAVLISGKPSGFIAGADISQLAACKSAEEATALAAGGQAIVNRMEACPKPVVAAIHGAAMGGGLEVALAADYRIASEDAKTVMSLPEVQLGLLPGMGGTQRLPRLVGLVKALPLVLTGKQVRPVPARRMGLVDGLADKHALRDAAIAAARGLADGSVKKRSRKPSLMDRFVEGIGKSIAFNKAEEGVRKQAGDKYPAPFAILRSVRAGLESGFAKGSVVEAEEFGKLAMTAESAALQSIFFASTALKKNRFGKPEKPSQTLAVVGAGLMGAGIAEVSCQKGFRVLLKDRDAAGVARGMGQIYDGMSSRVKRRAMSAFDRDRTMSRVVGLSDAHPWQRSFEQADMVIEAVFEDIELKHRIMADIEAVTPDHCVFASNTSALPIAKIAEGSSRPENVVGMHYFSPVPKMPLLEVITTPQTSEAAAAAAVDVGIRQGKTVIVVGDGPGFYTTRILSPMMVEAMSLVLDGVGVREVDSQLRKFGFPVGPITLTDEVGIDVGQHIIHYLGDVFGDRFTQGVDPRALDEMVAAGYLGRKSGKGFYLYEEPQKKKTGFLARFTQSKPRGKMLNPEADLMVQRLREGRPQLADELADEEIQQRMVTRFVNEAVLCLEDGVLHNAADGDIGAIFGLGFPPFLGGPFRYVDAIGADKFVDQMLALQDRYGSRFQPAQSLVDMAKSGAKFHSD